MKAKEMNMEEWIWIRDSGAPCHMTNDETSMFEVKTIVQCKLRNESPGI